MSSGIDNEIPQWKRDLIARLRSQNKRVSSSPPQPAALSRAVQQPGPETVAPVASTTSRDLFVKCNLVVPDKMVQERNSSWDWNALEAVNQPLKNGCKDSDSSEEDLRYGPGIVNKLKNKYLSLALRETSTRPSILLMRKAASLENILDENGPKSPPSNRIFTRNEKVQSPRYRSTQRGTSDMKRARSVEAISRTSLEENEEITRPKRESLHEDMLIASKEGSCVFDKVDEKVHHVSHRINRPRRITPIMNEREKPPVDVVKQAKLIFERRPEQRTKAPQHTGEVAAKVATYKNIIVQAKSKKPPIKTKPLGIGSEKPPTNGICQKPPKKLPETLLSDIQKEPKKMKEIEMKPPKEETAPSLPSPIPDISRVASPENERIGSKNTSLSETPDLIMTSSPLPTLNSPLFRISATENFLKEEIRNSAPSIHNKKATSPLKSSDFCLDEDKNGDTSPTIPENFVKEEIRNSALSPKTFHSKNTAKVMSPLKLNDFCFDEDNTSPTIPLVLSPLKSNACEEEGVKRVSPQAVANINNASNSITFNFATNNKSSRVLPLNNGEISNETKISPLQPLKLEINGVNDRRPARNEDRVLTSSPLLHTNNASKLSPNLTILEVEKNFINTVKTLQQPPPSKNVVVVKSSVEEVIKIQVAKVKKPPRQPENNSIVFKFTDRKDVPDYVHNDGSNRVIKAEKPKVMYIFGYVLEGLYSMNQWSAILISTDESIDKSDTFIIY